MKIVFLSIIILMVLNNIRILFNMHKSKKKNDDIFKKHEEVSNSLLNELNKSIIRQELEKEFNK